MTKNTLYSMTLYVSQKNVRNLLRNFKTEFIPVIFSFSPVKMDNSCVGNDDIRNNNNANNDNFTANEYYNKDYFSFSVKQK